MRSTIPLNPDNHGYVLGVDLGASWASTGVSAWWPASGCLRGFAAWPELPALPDRARRHGLRTSLLTQAVDDGDLIFRGRHSVDLVSVLAEAVSRWGAPAVVTYDRFKAELICARGFTLPESQCVTTWLGRWGGNTRRRT